MPLSPAQVTDIVAGEVENAFRTVSGTDEVPNSRIEGRMLFLEWLGQTRSFAISADATPEWLRARVATSLSAMFIMGTQARR